MYIALRKLLAMFFLLAALAVTHAAEPQTNTQARLVMGTILEITLCASKDSTLFNESFAIATELDALLSNYKNNSDITKLNSTPLNKPLRVDSRTIEFLKQALELLDSTHGLVDITIGQALNLRQTSANDSEIKQALALKGSGALRLITPNSVARTRAVQINTGALGKGFAVDRIIDLLKQRKVQCALLNFGQSSVAGLGAPPNFSHWNLKLKINDQALTLNLRDFRLSVSQALNDLDQPHILDPRNGQLVTQPTTAIILAKTAMEAEARSTAAVISNKNASQQNISLTIY